jgi:predicted house-cleaning NTP pyrophosphatase (Maf/HAM1 superfamily)
MEFLGVILLISVMTLAAGGLIDLVEFINDNERNTTKFQTGACFAQQGTDLGKLNNHYICTDGTKVIFKKTVQESIDEYSNFGSNKKE